MRIERIELDGFGRFADAEWTLNEGMTVLLGANEAGKTTLLNAVRALLFGFESTRDGRTWYPALAGGRRGGRLWLRTADGQRWRVERHGERGGVGALVVEAPNGNLGGQEELNRLLGGADRDLFNNIFAFGLGELEAFSSLSGEGVRSRIYGAGSGLGGTSVVDIERRLRAEQEASYKPRGSEQTLAKLLGRMEELRGTVATLEQQPATYEAARAELATLQGNRAELRDERRRVVERREHLRRVLDAQPAAARLTTLERSLAESDPALDSLPDDAEAQLDRLLQARDAASATLANVDEQLADAERRRGLIAIDQALLAEGAEIEALRDERLAHEARTADREAATAAAKRLDGELRDLLQRIGVVDEAQALALDDSIPSIQAVRDMEARLGTTSAAADRLGARVDSARRDLANAEAELPADEADAEQVAARRRAVAALVDLRVEAAMLQERERVGTSAGRLPSWLLPAAAGVLTFAVMALGATILGIQPWGTAVGLFVAAAAAVVARATRRSSAGIPGGPALDLRSLAARRRALLADANLPADADDAAISAAAEELAMWQAALRSSEAQRARLAERRASLERLEAELRDAAEARDDARRSWAAWLEGHLLATDLSPDAARQVLEAVANVRRLARQRDEQHERAAAIGDAAAAYDARLDALLGRLGRPAGTDASLRPSTVVALATELQETVAARQRAADLEAGLADLGARRVRLVAAAEAADRALSDRLADWNATDPDQLRTAARAAAQRRSLRQAIAQETATLVALAGSEAAVTTLLAEASAGDPASLEAQLTDAATDADRLEAAESEALTREGELRNEIARLETSDELGAARQELAVLQGRAEEESRQWAVRAIALALLSETRQRYERERQPQVVHDAQRFFASITDGRYARIVAPPGESNVRVEPESGSPRTTEELSRGTAEQLYLALRFGLIEQFARNAEGLPVVMDDILVNFDRQRATRAARAIRDLATRHQIVFFTCHPQTAELLDPDGVATLRLD
ncbi:MAG TPA: AAA family ATPase [Candidatus Limnocylindria bacterium]|nr:AAA family ATPase [Candidatus Limnocylindria bacterium]